MKPRPFRYVAPRSLDDALDVLSTYGDDAKVLAGGQSLGPLLNLRLADPGVLVDLNRVPNLINASLESPPVHLAPMARQRDAERSDEVARVCPLLAEALPHIAHPTIRNRGTVGGSLAHADPAAELPAVAVALDAQITACSVRGRRVIAAADFFRGYFTTALEDDEILSSVWIPPTCERGGWCWQEFAPRRGDYAVVGVATTVALDPLGTVTDARVVGAGVSDTPIRFRDAEDVLVGQRPDRELLLEASHIAATSCDPPDDLMGTPRYRRHLVALLTKRGLRIALNRAREN